MPVQSKNLTRGDLIFFIAKLHGAMVAPEMEPEEKAEIMKKTSFDISDEDDAGYEAGKKRYFDG